MSRSFTFDVSGYIICRAVFTSEQLVAAEDDLAALAEDETVLAYVQQLGGDAHLPGPPTRPGLDSPPALLRAAAGLQGHDAASDYSKAYVSLPRDGSATQAQRWSCRGVRAFIALGGGASCGRSVALLPGSHHSHFSPPAETLLGNDEEMLYHPTLRPGDVLLTAATVRYMAAQSPALSCAVCEYSAGGTDSHAGVREARDDTEAEMPAWVAKLSPVERQLTGWGEPGAQAVTDGQNTWLEAAEGVQPSRHPSLLVEDTDALGIDPRDLYFWDTRGYLVSTVMLRLI